MPDTSHTRLNDLKQRWRQDPSSRLFLQLADEHRKYGQLPEAVKVLEQGLENRPNDLSALVALGRCQLELDRVAEAIEALQTVVTRDPTHIVANKLLVEAHLQNADAEKAGDRLETYRLLNDRDPEIDHLEYRLEKLRSETDQQASTVVTDEPFELVEETELEEVSVAEHGVGEVAEQPAVEEGAAAEDGTAEPGGDGTEAVAEVGSAPLDETPLPEAADLARVEPEAVAEEPAAPAGEIVAPPADAGDPFQLADELPIPGFDSLWARPPSPAPSKLEEPFQGLGGLDAERHWELLAGEGIFASPVVAESASAEPVSEEPSFEEPVLEEPAAVESAAEPVAAEGATVGETVESEATAEPEAEEPTAPMTSGLMAAAGTLVAGGLAAGIAAAAGTSVSEENEPTTAIEAPYVAEAEPAALATATEAPSAAESEDRVAEPTPEAATATLGELYAKQGHREEAKRIFRLVLDRDPANQAALAGLEQLEGRPPRKSLTAADLLAVRSASGEVPAGLTAKKVLVLGNYMQHLRASARAQVE